VSGALEFKEKERERDKRVYAAELIDDDAYICGFT